MSPFLMGALTFAAGMAAGLWLGGSRQTPAMEFRPYTEDEDQPVVVSHERKSAAFRRLTQPRVNREVH